MNVKRLEEIRKGWSQDRKFHALDDAGRIVLLRVSPPESFAQKQEEFRWMRRCEALGIPMSRALDFGTEDGEVYALHEWIDGDDAKDIIPTLPTARAYAYGLEAGRILRKIHTLPAPAPLEPWGLRFRRKLDRKIERYLACPLHYEEDEGLLWVVREDRDGLDSRPQTFQHGDYHIGNMMIDREGRLRIIDFNRLDFGDPWEEFNRIVWSAQVSPAFASGCIAGYFEGEIPEAFWRLLRLYISSNALGSLPWAIPFGEEQIAVMRKQTAEILAWYDGMNGLIPSWYGEKP